PINSTWLISSVPTPCSRSLKGLDVASPRKFMLWNRYCIIVRISPNWPPRPSCSALAAAGSGWSTTISLMSCWVCKYMFLLKWVGRQMCWPTVGMLSLATVRGPGRGAFCSVPGHRCPRVGRCHRGCGPMRRRGRSWRPRAPGAASCRVVDGNEVGRTVVIYHKAVEEEHQIHDAATNEVRACTGERAGQDDPGDTE